MSTLVPPATPPAPRQAAEPRFDQLRVLLRSPTFVVGVLIVGWWIVCAIAGPWIVRIDPYASDPLNSLTPPDGTHWFGTDQLGRDVFSRVIVGARDILTIAPLATLLGTVAGTALGLIVGYFEGWVDNVWAARSTPCSRCRS
jgi:ABC-type dipeptide/oligopeptide/nickel transport systems, permease components